MFQSHLFYSFVYLSITHFIKLWLNERVSHKVPNSIQTFLRIILVIRWELWITIFENLCFNFEGLFRSPNIYDETFL